MFFKQNHWSICLPHNAYLYQRKLKLYAQGSLFGLGFSTKKKDHPKKKDPPISILPNNNPPTTLSTNAASVTTVSATTDPADNSIDLTTTTTEIDTTVTASTAKTAPRSCEGVIPLKDKDTKRHLDMVYRYCRHTDEGSKYLIKKLGGVQPNIYSTVCDGVGIVRGDKRSPGVRCDPCNDLWLRDGSRIKSSVIKKKAVKIIEVLHVLHDTTMTERSYQILDNYTRNKDKDLSVQGVELKKKANDYKEFYKEIKSVSKSESRCLTIMTPPD